MFKASQFIATGFAVLLAATLAVACNSSTDPESQPETPPGVDARYFPAPEHDLERISSDAQDFYVQTVLEGLSVPWGLAFLPDDRVLITERAGSIHIVENGELREQPLDNVPQVHAHGQGGMLDIVLHPDYENNGWIYITYSRPDGSGGSNTALSRMRLDGYAFTDVELLFSGEPTSNRRHHFGSRIVFDDDGYVYFSIGDRGMMATAQDLSTHAGVVIRLHDDGRVPSDNPFADPANLPEGQSEARPEIYAWGSRNIQGMQLHPETREVWSHEHGPRGGDEINIIRPALNYGWPEITHGINYDGSIITPDTAREGMEQPLLHWTPSIAPSGMAFVTGDRYPGWKNSLMVGTLAPRYLHRVELDGERVVAQEELLPGIGRVRDVRMAPDGYLYVAAENPGIIYRLIPAE
ncbi:MAG: PQQ-dependent sugar dehydrogenase [Balneolaceae bacterium]|nr:MAG: PQQ-dependent sugar dehydrogenase [Balneolaceae bacterium]